MCSLSIGKTWLPLPNRKLARSSALAQRKKRGKCIDKNFFNGQNVGKKAKLILSHFPQKSFKGLVFDE
jgi:hypothetical protein